MDRPVLLCGLGRVGWRILDHLRAAGVTVTVVDLHAEAKDPRLADVTFLPGDCRKTEVLESAGVREAGGIIIVTSDDLVNVTTALLVRRLNAEARIVVRMFNQNLIARLGGAVRNTVALSVSALTAPLLALTAITGNAMTAIRLPTGPRQIADIRVEPGSSLIGRSIADVAAQNKLAILAYTKSGGEPQLWHGLDAAQLLQAGDSMLACGEPEAMAGLFAIGRDELLGSVRWAGWLRRQIRTLRRTLAAVDTSVKIATAALVIALLGTTAVFRFALDATWVNGFYQAVGLITTGADLPKEASPSAKTFLGAMKLAGTALIAAFTAIFTQYLIRARLGGALEARRIPDEGHIVVCGLGNIGFRCVEELVKLERPVVAIDAVNDNPFAATVRRMGVPVIVGNATVAAVLAQARVATAGAVIAATDSELSNLEIALLVREANAKQRVVVRLNEADFAEAVREAARIRHALAIPKLAAPAFAAALYGDRVQSLLTVGTKTLVVLEIVVQENETHLIGKTVRRVIEENSMLPLCLNQQANIDGETTLKINDSLTVMIELSAMEQMIRRRVISKTLIAENAVVIQDAELQAHFLELIFLLKCAVVQVLRLADERKQFAAADAEASQRTTERLQIGGVNDTAACARRTALPSAPAVDRPRRRCSRRAGAGLRNRRNSFAGLGRRCGRGGNPHGTRGRRRGCFPAPHGPRRRAAPLMRKRRRRGVRR